MRIVGEGKGDIKKVWVCGPPLLEEKFDIFMEKLCPKFKMNFTT